MALRDRWKQAAIALIIVLALGALAVQLATDHAALGILSVILFAVPGFLLTQAVGSRPLSEPEVIFAGLGATLVLAVLTGIVSALSAHGLDPSSVAAVQLVALLAAAAAWLRRPMRGRSRSLATTLRHHRRHDHAVFVGADGQQAHSENHRPRRIGAGSIALIVLGILLGSAGFAIATQAAADQSYTGFVQFWSVPTDPGSQALIGVRDATGLAVDCRVAIDRPGQPEFDWHIGAIDNGQTWLGQLPPAAGANTAPWLVSLHCAASDGSSFDRRLNIDPPA